MKYFNRKKNYMSSQEMCYVFFLIMYVFISLVFVLKLQALGLFVEKMGRFCLLHLNEQK